MGNQNIDVIRHEDTTANLPSSSRNGQVTFETDSTHRQRRAMLAGTPIKHWTPDEDFTADIPLYTNPIVPGVANVKQGLDTIISGASLKWYEPVISIYDNTSALPTPSEGDRYIALVTANGWTAKNIYTYISAAWVEAIPATGGVVVVKYDNLIYEYTGAVWQASESNKVKVDNAGTPGFLEDKIVEDDGAYVTIQKTGDQLVLGFDDHDAYASAAYWLNPVISIFDNTSALPVGPSGGDRYIAKVTAHGWTINHIYEWSLSTWLESIPWIGSAVKDMTIKIQWHWDGTNWNAEAYQPTADQKAALAGTSGTPSVSNKYVTDADARNTNARTPTAHNLAGAEHNADTIVNLNLKLSDGDVLSTKAGEIAALTAKGTPTTSDVLLIEDVADSNNKKKITIANLPAAAPAAHAFGGSLHTADTLANLNAKISDADVISNAASEISALTEKTVPIGADLVIIEDSAAGNAKKKVQISNLAMSRYLFYADEVLSPNNADWPINALAPASADSLNNALVIRAFDDTAEEGIGFLVEIPAGVTGITFQLRSRAQTAPGDARQVVPALYTRQMANNTAVGAWSARTSMTAIDIPTNDRFQFDSQSITLATLGLTAGNIVQFEMTRYPAHASDNLVGDWNLLELVIRFY